MKQLSGLDSSFLNMETPTTFGHVASLIVVDAGELEPPEGPSQLWTDEVRHPTLLAGLTMEREALYERIDARVDAMIAAGAREEVLRADAAGGAR